MHSCGTHFTNFFSLIQDNAKNQLPFGELIAKAVEYSEPAEFYLKTLRAYPQLIGVDYRKILKHDPGFNINFIEEQT